MISRDVRSFESDFSINKSIGLHGQKSHDQHPDEINNSIAIIQHNTQTVQEPTQGHVQEPTQEFDSEMTISDPGLESTDEFLPDDESFQLSIIIIYLFNLWIHVVSFRDSDLMIEILYLIIYVV